MNTLIQCSSLLGISCLLAFALGAKAQNLAGESTICGSEITSIPWTYCISKPDDSVSLDVIYYFHGGPGDAREWSKDTGLQAIASQWRRDGFHAPRVVSVSFGNYWLLTPKAKLSRSGLIEVFEKDVVPFVEQRLLSGKTSHRFVLGVSMGGFNATQVYFRSSLQIERAAFLCPAYLGISPFASHSTNQMFSTKYGVTMHELELNARIERQYIDNEAIWRKLYPVNQARINLSSRSAPIYLSTASGDSTYNLGARAFWAIAEKNKSPITFESVHGGHCDFDPRAVAGFFEEGL